MIGDGIGSSEIKQHKEFSSKEDCYAFCSISSKDGKNANGVTVDAATERKCYCEFGMTSRNSLTIWKSAFIDKRKTV